MSDPVDQPGLESPGAAPAPAPFWSPWATVGWGFVVGLVFVLSQLAVVVVWSTAAALASGPLDPETPPAAPTLGGDLLASSTIVSAVLCSTLVLFVVWTRSRSRSRDTLGLAAPSAAGLAGWLGLTGLLILASDTLTTSLGRPIVPEFMDDIVGSAQHPVLLWLAIVIAAPVFEELFVRGFLLEGLRRGRLGDAGAIVVTSVFWASIHLQYGLYEIATICVFGLVLGLARLRGGSLWVPIAMHIAANLVATVQATLGL
jgi:membrane protease YdiL (CAAX protease family)